MRFLSSLLVSRRPVAGILLAGAVFGGALLFGACNHPETQHETLVVAATVPPHAWLVGEVAGPAAKVVTFLPRGASPHSHQPTDAEITHLARARIFFRSGVPVEHGAWLRALGSAGMHMVDLRGVDLREERSDHDSHPHDPHTWLSPRELRDQARRVETALAELVPAETGALAERRAALDAELADLDAELTDRLAPHRGRAFFVYHPSWTHFAAEYELVQVAVERDGSPPSDAELTALAARARETGARVLFVDPRNAGSGARALAATLGLEIRLLDPLEREVPHLLRHAAGELIRSWDGPRDEAP